MALIRIQECSAQEGIFQAKVSFDHRQEYDVTVRDPFSKEEEERLEWYFEEHIKFPFTNQVKAKEAATSVIAYGESLFMQVFSTNSQILSEYRRVAQMGLNTLQIEIAGQPSFHALHWESLKDPDVFQPLALQATIVRKSRVFQVIPTVAHSSPTINLLIVVARPHEQQDIGYRTISRPLVESLHQNKLPVKIDIVHPGTYKALEHHLRLTTERYGGGYYHILHFDVHGAILPYLLTKRFPRERYGRDVLQSYEGMKAFLLLEREEDHSPDLLEATELAQLLRVYQIPIVILNACQSSKQVGEHETSLASHLTQCGVQTVLGMSYSIAKTAGELLMKVLYQQLSEGHELAAALRAARSKLFKSKERYTGYHQRVNLEDWLLPVVYQNQPQRLTLRPFTTEERGLFWKKEDRRYTPMQPTYGFVGRDLDILRIEKLLLNKCNIVLVQGMIGVGKTALLHHLGVWWQSTGFVEQVCYFSCDKYAWTQQEILSTLVQNLLEEFPLPHDLRPLSLDIQLALLTKKLRTQRHLLIIDHLEFILGDHAALQHPALTEGQVALRRFLSGLMGGKTFVLVGSRRNEVWFTEDILENSRYELRGLDPEAAAELSAYILARHVDYSAPEQYEQYMKNKDLLQLLWLLHGFPLALEGVLAHLERQMPEEVLEAFQKGNIRLDVNSDEREKLKSILSSVRYSYEKLSEEAQLLLLCVAPFTSVIGEIGFEVMKWFRQQPALAELPFECWSMALKEAQDWGLLSPSTGTPGYLYIQPLFPYFLRSQLWEKKQIEIQQAIETAFRESYDELGEVIWKFLRSKEPDKQQIGHRLGGLEYDNLNTALYLALKAQVSIHNIYTALAAYSEHIGDHTSLLEKGQEVLHHLKRYPRAKWIDALGLDVVGVIDNIAFNLYQSKDFAAAEAMYQQALALLLENKSLDAQEKKQSSASIYHQLGAVASAQHQWTQAERYYRSALEIRGEFSDHPEHIGSYHQLGLLAQEQHQWAQAEYYYRRALEIAIEVDDQTKQAAAYYHLGTVAQEQRQWTQAIDYYQPALEIYQKFGELGAQAGIYQCLATIALEKRQWAGAEREYQRALAIYITSGNQYDQAAIYEGLGNAARKQRQWAQAEQYQMQALEIYIKFGDHSKRTGPYHELGSIALEQSQWKQAEQYYQQALEIKIKLGDHYKQAPIYHQLGVVAEMQNQWEQAKHYSKQALEIHQQFGDSEGVMRSYHQLGKVAQAQQQWTQACDYFLQTLEIARDIQSELGTNVALIALFALWLASRDESLYAAIAPFWDTTPEEVEATFRKMEITYQDKINDNKVQFI
ncbi:MAG TPA: tetratricopeptide repeat protein [Ktedonobacteraceae bacterium]|nr:tetratricopeptide repeat protein [Ktedonobacteraceae bacterium]